MLTWYQWLIAVGGIVLTALVLLGIYRSRCSSATAGPSGLRVTDGFRNSVAIPWSSVRYVHVFGRDRLVVGVKPTLLALYPAYVVDLASSPDANTFVAEVGRHTSVTHER